MNSRALSWQDQATTDAGAVVKGRAAPRYAAVLAVLAVVALSGPRLRAPLWRDEWATWMFSSLSSGDLVRATSRVDAVFVAYYALLHPLTSLGLPPGYPRVLSLALVAVAVWRLVVLLGRAMSPLATLFGGVVLAVNPVCVQAATTGRSYAAALCLTVIATELMMRRSPGAGYVIACCLIPLMHPFALALVIPHLAVRWAMRLPVRPVVLAWTAGGAVAGPIGLLSSRQGTQVSWVQPLSRAQVTDQLSNALGGLHAHTEAHVLTVLTVLCVAGCRAAVRRRVNPWWLLAVLLVVVPPGALATLSALGRPAFVDRYLVAVPVGAAVLAALLVDALVRHVPPMAGMGLVTVVSGLLVAGAVSVAPPADRSIEGHPAVDRRLASMVRPGDAVIVHQGESQTGLVFGYAANLHDSAWQADAVRALVTGQRTYVERTVVAVQGPSVQTRAGDGHPAARALGVRTYGAPVPPLAARRGCVLVSTERIGETYLDRLRCPGHPGTPSTAVGG